jgi:transposase
MRIMVAVESVDFRCGIDGLCRLCRQVLQDDPFSGAVFVFRSRSAASIKLLAFDGQGYWLFQKRLSQGKFRHWPRSSDDHLARQLLVHQLQALLAGGDPETAQAAPQWRLLPMARKRGIVGRSAGDDRWWRRVTGPVGV